MLGTNAMDLVRLKMCSVIEACPELLHMSSRFGNCFPAPVLSRSSEHWDHIYDMHQQ